MIHAALSYPIIGRLRADPGEKHEPRVATSSSAETQYLHFVACPSLTTGAFATAGSGVCLLTQAAIEKQTFSALLTLRKFVHRFRCRPVSERPAATARVRRAEVLAVVDSDRLCCKDPASNGMPIGVKKKLEPESRRVTRQGHVDQAALAITATRHVTSAAAYLAFG